MNNKTVILTGFSTAGKSHYLREIYRINPFPIYYLDSDKFVSKEYGGHIYNIFMELGREQALKHIESKEKEFIQHLSGSKVPTLVAAGPFILIRDGWDSFVTNYRPQVIYLKKSLKNIYKDLCARKVEQKNTLDTENPNFGSWDLNVTTEEKNGTYQDIEESSALTNIQGHLSSLEPVYEKYAQETYDADQLRTDVNKSRELTSTIIDMLR